MAVFYGEAIARYGFGGSHPLGTDRLGVFWTMLISENISNVVAMPELGTDRDALSFHDKYVGLVRAASKDGGVLLGRGDTPAFHGVLKRHYVLGSSGRA
jgi:acetoin utilization protein AcuC